MTLTVCPSTGITEPVCPCVNAIGPCDTCVRTAVDRKDHSLVWWDGKPWRCRCPECVVNVEVA